MKKCVCVSKSVAVSNAQPCFTAGSNDIGPKQICSEHRVDVAVLCVHLFPGSPWLFLAPKAHRSQP